MHPFLLKLYADGGYHGPVFQSTVRKILRQIDVETVKRSDLVKGFAISPKRWIVERTIASARGISSMYVTKDLTNFNSHAVSVATCLSEE